MMVYPTEVQEYLSNRTYEDLEEDFGIQANVYNDRVVLNYNQINSPKHHPMVRECRGLILSIPDHEILCRSFDRFYNYNEDPKTKEFDIRKAKVFQKVDGSLCNVYWDGEKWQVATRKMAFAEGFIPSKKKTYRDIFIEALGDDPDVIFKDIDKDLVIICELVSPETRVVTPYSEKGVYILEVRNKITGLYLGHEITMNWPIPKNVGWNYPEQYFFSDFNECFDNLEKLPAMEEGYVADLYSWKLKIKNPAYLAIAHLRLNGEINRKRICILVASQDYDEYLSYFPEDKVEFQPYIDAYDKMIEEVNRLWEENKDKEQKEFALSVKDCHAKSVLFNLKKGKSIEETVAHATDNFKERLISGYVKE